MIRQFPTGFRSAALGLALSSAAGAAQALDIQFDYRFDSSNFFSSARRALLDAAASPFEQRITDDLLAITSAGINQFEAQFSNPTTGVNTSIPGFSVAAETLVVFVGARPFAGNTLGFGGFGGYSASGTAGFLETADHRGQTGAAENPPTDFGPWGGAISFDSDSNWYFDPNPATTESFSGFDFYSVATHELGHVLGIGTAGSWDTWVAGTQFGGANSVAVHGGDVPLTNDAGHWADGTRSPIDGAGSFETAMDPLIAAGQRKPFTDLDWAGLQDVGWQVSAVPEPSEYLMMLAGIAMLVPIVRRRTMAR